MLGISQPSLVFSFGTEFYSAPQPAPLFLLLSCFFSWFLLP